MKSSVVCTPQEFNLYIHVIDLQVGHTTKLLLEEIGYKFEFRGVKEVKGKGQMITYFLIDPELQDQEATNF